MTFPDTKYMGSKQAILPFIMNEMKKVEFKSVLDAFSGSACVSYGLKQLGKRVISNDFLEFCYHISKATVENNRTKLSDADIKILMKPNPLAKAFIRDTFAGLYFGEEDCHFLDNISANLYKLNSQLKKSLALSALCRACMKKRPRGIFTFTGRKGWDGRRDLNLSMKEQFLEAVRLLNEAIFSNKLENKATCLDVFETSTKGIDLVYIDTPYISPHSDCDYTRRYHFVEGLCSYWADVDIQKNTLTKKINSRPTLFKSTKTAHDAFYNLFSHFSSCKIALSYSSNAIPSKGDMVDLLKIFKKSVKVTEINHKYCFGNHHHKVGNNNNNVKEYLFIAT